MVKRRMGKVAAVAGMVIGGLILGTALLVGGLFLALSSFSPEVKASPDEMKKVERTVNAALAPLVEQGRLGNGSYEGRDTSYDAGFKWRANSAVRVSVDIPGFLIYDRDVLSAVGAYDAAVHEYQEARAAEKRAFPSMDEQLQVRYAGTPEENLPAFLFPEEEWNHETGEQYLTGRVLMRNCSLLSEGYFWDAPEFVLTYCDLQNTAEDLDSRLEQEPDGTPGPETRLKEILGDFLILPGLDSCAVGINAESRFLAQKFSSVSIECEPGLFEEKRQH